MAGDLGEAHVHLHAVFLVSREIKLGGSCRFVLGQKAGEDEA